MKSPKERLKQLNDYVAALTSMSADTYKVIGNYIDFLEKRVQELQCEIQILKSMKRDDDNARRG